MKNQVTVIIPLRNREAWRIKDQVLSIRTSGANPSFHVVDYGSDEQYVNDYNKVCSELNIQYTHMYAEGLPWNKCKAINYGVKNCSTPFMVMSDVDMIYEGNSLQWCLDNFQSRNIYHIPLYFLNKKGSLKDDAPQFSPGGFQFIEVSAFTETGGFDECFDYWGAEDFDWLGRLLDLGYIQKWLPNQYRVTHQWHIVSDNNFTRPLSANDNALIRTYKNKIHPKIKQDWGLPLTKEMRPILQEMKQEKPYVIKAEIDRFSAYQMCKDFIEAKSNKFIELQLGKRIKKRPLDSFRNITMKLLKPITALTGIKMQANINTNFDAFFPLIALLKENGLRDYYITQDCSTVYLLWE